MSQTFTLTGVSSRLSADIYPPLLLDPKYEYSLALTGFHTYNSIPNIEDGRNKLYYYQGSTLKTVTIPTGAYEVGDIERYLQKIIVPQPASKDEMDEFFSLKPNTNTLKCELKSVYDIDFTRKDNIGVLLGFSAKKLPKKQLHESDRPVNIVKVSTIRVECNIINGSYYNGKPSHTLFEFSPMVDPGFAIDIEPKNLVYLPVNRHIISNISVNILDQGSYPINFLGEQIIVRLELKRTASF